METANKWLFIVNPVSGNASSKEVLPQLETQIAKHGIDAEIVFTEKPGHASELALEYAAKGFRYLIAVGGDGTMNEIVTPLIDRKNIVFGIVPCGTGNDFIQILGFSDRFDEEQWDVFFAAHTIDMDAGSVNGKYFLNGMGLGFDAQVAAENYTEPGVVQQGGKGKYVWHIVKTLLFYKEKEMSLSLQGKTENKRLFINTVANGRRFAGGFLLTPKAIANDGLLDVCYISKLNLLQRFRILLMVPKGTHINDKKVSYYQCPELHISFKERMPYHVDGELNFASEFDIKALPHAVNIIYNHKGKHFFDQK